MRIDSNTTIKLGDRNIVRIKIGDVVIWEKKTEPVDADYFYVENTYNGGNTISVKQTITGEPDVSTYAKTLQYSKDKTTWSTITLSSTAYDINLNQGERVYFRGNEGVLNYYNNDATIQAITNILGTQTHIIGGNINTLVNYITPNELTLTQGVFALLFQNNTTITSAENLTLPTTQMAEGCYRGLFYGCTSLTSIPELPATELAPNCYRAMLANCTSLTTSTKLPATKLSTDCYRELFFKCASLVNPPELPAEILAEGCYRALFFKCTSLNNITVYANDISATDCTTNWLSGVASTGTFNNYGDATYTINSASGIPTGWTEKKPDYLYVENTYNGTNTISVKQTIVESPDVSTYAKTLQYSKDRTNWSTITLSSTAYNINLNQGERLYFRGNEGVFNYWYSRGAKKAITTISANQTHTVGGNINTLLDYQDPYGLTLPQGAFNSIFENNTKLTSASDITLPPSVDGSLSTYCYLYLFKNCSNLTTVPKSIPSKKQGEYSCNGMFQYTAITTAPTLSATTLSNGCYYSLFEGCSKLVNAPALPATEMAPNCYRNLFYGCTSLVNAPELPATTLADSCYRKLFYGCSKLNNITVYANDISATNCTSNWLSGVASSGTFNNYGDATYTINSVSGIPTGWVEIKPNEPDYLYIENTYNGSNTIYFTTTQSGIHPSSDKYSNQVEYSTDKVNWTTLTFNPSTPQTVIINTGEKLYLRNDTGVFNYYNGSANTYNTNINVSRSNIIGGNINTLLDYKNPDTVPLSHSCFFGLFRDNIATTDVSGLKFGNKTLSTGCFREMFYNCPELTKAPVLSAIELSDRCYQEMFYMCSKLNSLTVYANNVNVPDCTLNWLYGVASSGTFRNLGSATYTTDSTSGIPSGWVEVKN